MLRVLTLASLFPSAARPTFGVFVERQTLGLSTLDGVEVQVAAPVGLPAWPLSLHPHYRASARLPLREDWKGLAVHRPRFPVLPRIGEAAAGKAMAEALLPLLRDLRRDLPFDVIDAEFFWPDGVAAMHLSRALGIPCSIKARGSDINYWATRPRVAPQLIEAGRAAGGLLAVSAALRESMISLGLPRENIAVHYTGVDAGLFRPVDREAAKARLGVSGPLILSAGALIPRKGQALAIEAIARLPRVTLILVGDGPDRGALEKGARSAGVADRVRFLGNRPHEEIAALLAAADATVLPSESEGLANVWVESLSCGTPIVIADAGGAREVIDGPLGGRIVPRDPDAIVAALRDILADPPSQEEVRNVASRFSWETNARRLRSHLETVAGRAADPAARAA